MDRFISSEKGGICTLIGDPVSHSLSPAMHNTAFEFLGLDMEYIPLRVRAEVLGGVLEGLRDMGFKGANVTIPHKSRVMKYLDRIDVSASRIGAVNTIVNENGVLAGYNTDADGARMALEASGVDPMKIERALILGAGDTARTMGFMLAGSGVDLLVCNRTPGKARKLSKELSGKFEGIMVIPVSEDELPSVMEGITLVVNCTPVGMKGMIQGIPVSPDLINGDMTVFDLVYNPMDTMLVQASRKAGARIVYGYRMLVYQGAGSFKLWTGMEPPVSLMDVTVAGYLAEPEDNGGC